MKKQRKQMLSGIGLILMAATLTGAQASAGTITVTSTLAVAGPMEDPLLATYENVTSNATLRDIADVLAGHLGSFTASTDVTSNDALITIGLSFQDMTESDFLRIDFSLHGTHTAGSGGDASFLIDDGTSVTNAAGITCNSFNQQFHGVDCYPATSVEVMIPLVNVDSLFLTWLLKAGVGTAPGSADYYNSDDFKITVPSGTTIVNNPGGVVFQTQGAAAVPEPASVLLIGSGMLFAALLRRTSV